MQNESPHPDFQLLALSVSFFDKPFSQKGFEPGIPRARLTTTHPSSKREVMAAIASTAECSTRLSYAGIICRSLKVVYKDYGFLAGCLNNTAIQLNSVAVCVLWQWQAVHKGLVIMPCSLHPILPATAEAAFGKSRLLRPTVPGALFCASLQ